VSSINSPGQPWVCNSATSRQGLCTALRVGLCSRLRGTSGRVLQPSTMDSVVYFFLQQTEQKFQVSVLQLTCVRSWQWKRFAKTGKMEGVFPKVRASCWQHSEAPFLRSGPRRRHSVTFRLMVLHKERCSIRVSGIPKGREIRPENCHPFGKLLLLFFECFVVHHRLGRGGGHEK
jgi:hypothetical protein